MKKITATIIDRDKKYVVFAESGTVISEIIDKAGVSFAKPCGGLGKCGKCMVKAVGTLSEITAEELRTLSKEQLEISLRLACCTRALGDVTVTLGENSAVKVKTDGHSVKFRFSPLVRACTVTLAQPDTSNQIDDETNLLTALRTAGVKVDCICTDVLRLLPKYLRSHDMTVTAVICDKTVIALSDEPIIGLAVDIGTTTVAAYFRNLANGEKICVKSGANAQKAYGADVISRIEKTISEEDGLQKLHSAIIGQINVMIDEFCAETKLSYSSIYAAVLTGNTVMQHLAAGIPPENIANAPFIPATLFGNSFFASELGLNIHKNAWIWFPPSCAGYVGGDITSGLLSSGMMDEHELALFLDIGTNGEMALGNRSAVLTCATAAGPAFEGAHIHMGTAGISGAIDTVTLDGNDIRITTIDDKAPVGICGSGIIDAVAAMLDCGVLDETGRIVDEDELENDAFAPRIIEHDGQNAFLLDKEHNIFITQKDIREIQLAKAAIAAGMRTLLYAIDKSMNDVSRIYLAGGFGAHINKKSACRIGLLPNELCDKIITVGNAAGMGAVSALVSQSAMRKNMDIRDKATYLELSGNRFFQDEYVMQMMFE